MTPPRPDTSVTRSAVEKPGAKIMSTISCSLNALKASRSTRLRSSATVRMRARSIPPPSSRNSTNTVIQRSREHVQERLEQHLDDGLVRFRVSTLDQQLGRLAARGSHFAHQAGKTLEHMAKRQHAHAEDEPLQLAHKAVEPGMALLEQVGGPRVSGLSQLGDMTDRVLDHGQLARHVDEPIDAGGVDTQR